jgi:hypothetical protein
MNNRLENIVKFEFTHPDDKDFEGCLKVTVRADAGKYLNETEFPLRFQVYNNNSYIPWNTDLYPGYWSSYTFITYCKADIITASGIKLLEWNWNVFEHGDFCHQAFYLWAMENKGCRGISIGTHDGTSGEWVGPVSEGILPAVLVEPSDRQHYLLERLYANKSWITIDKSCVTPNGGEVRFYEAGLGHTNSVNPDHVSKYLPDLPINEKVFQSLTLRQMLDKHGIGNGKWWMHLDVEDLDDKLIVSFDYNGINLPECIIFENENLPEERFNLVSNWLQSHSYECTSSGRNTICFLNK